MTMMKMSILNMHIRHWHDTISHCVAQDLHHARDSGTTTCFHLSFTFSVVDNNNVLTILTVL